MDVFEQYANQWWDLEGPFRQLHRINPLRMTFLEMYVGSPLAGLRVLDIGCGGGILSISLAARGAKVVGLDTNVSTIEAAKVQRDLCGLDIVYHALACEVFLQDPVNRGCFDLVCVSEILEHVEDPALMLSWAAKAVKPNGFVFASTLNRTLKSALLAVTVAENILGWVPKGTHKSEDFIKPGELIAMARASGLDLNALSGITYAPLAGTWQLDPHDLSMNYAALFSAGE